MADTELGTELNVLMREQRLGPKELSDAAGVSRRTVYNVLETGKASLDTIWSLATGLATDPYKRRIDRLTQRDAFTRLLRAAGYPRELSEMYAVDPEDALTFRFRGDREKARALDEYLARYADLPASEREMFDRAILRKARQPPPTER